MRLLFVYNSNVAKIGNIPDFNRKISVSWNRIGDRFKKLEIGSAAEMVHWNRKSKPALMNDY